MLRGFGIGPYQQLAVVGIVAETGPDLLPAHHVIVAITDRSRTQASQVRARPRLAEPLTPDMLTLQDGRKVKGLLLGRRLRDQGRSGMTDPDEIVTDIRCPTLLGLFEKDQVLDRGRPHPREPLRAREHECGAFVHEARVADRQQRVFPQVGFP